MKQIKDLKDVSLHLFTGKEIPLTEKLRIGRRLDDRFLSLKIIVFSIKESLRNKWNM